MKPVFVEPMERDRAVTVYSEYRQCCIQDRGAVLMMIQRGKYR